LERRGQEKVSLAGLIMEPGIRRKDFKEERRKIVEKMLLRFSRGKICPKNQRKDLKGEEKKMSGGIFAPSMPLGSGC